MKPYAITDKSRLTSAPEVPTVDEAGLPGFHVSLWYGLWAPKGTAKDIIAKLNAALVETLADPVVQKRFDELGVQITARDQQTPDALRSFQKAEAERWWPIIKAANISAN